MRAASLAACAALLLACGGSGAHLGERVRIHYAAYVDDKLYDSTEGREPVTIKLGEGALPAPAEHALIGLHPGQKAELRVNDAYGRRDPNLVQALPLSAFGPLTKQLAVGKRVLGTSEGKPTEATVVKLEGGKAWLDFNHRLAGKTVSFKLTLVSIER